MNRPHKGHKHEGKDTVYDDFTHSLMYFMAYCKYCLEHGYEITDDDISGITRYIQKINHRLTEIIDREGAKNDYQ